MMNDFDEAELDKLSKLARIKLTDEEKKTLFSKLSSVLDYIEELRELNTDQVKPTNHVLETHINVMREDVIEPSPLSTEAFLNNSPDQISGMIRIPPVMNKESS